MSDNYTQELDLNIKPRSSDLLPSHLNLTLPMNTNLGVEWHAILFWSFPTSRTVARLESTLWVERSFFDLRRNNLRPKQLACWPLLYSDAFENIDEPRTPYSVMIAETISSACFALLVVVFCCVIKIYTVVKGIPLSRNERVRVVYARDNQRALPVAREPTVYFPQAKWWTFTEPWSSEENRWF